jgi:NADH-quinone oxidoreductase subunit F
MHGVVPGVTFLQDANLGRKREVGEKVVVIGGGSTAFDAARTAMRLGARSVSLLYRREVADMPAGPHEVVEAREEGIEIRTLVAPVAIVGNGKVTGVRCIQMVLSGFDHDGRRRPQPVAGSEFVVPADLVIPAISQQADLPVLAHEEVQQTRNGALVVDPVTKMTSLPGVFAGGDVIRGPDVVITAIADGKAAAQAIDWIWAAGNSTWGTHRDPACQRGMDVAEHERFRMQHVNPKCAGTTSTRWRSDSTS